MFGMLPGNFPFYLLCLLGGFIGTFILFSILLAFYKLRDTLEYDDVPPLGVLYNRALWWTIMRFFDGKKNKEFTWKQISTYSRISGRSIKANNFKFSKDDLEKYKQVIDACNEPVVPTCFLECSFIPLMLMGVTTTEFRLSPIGLIHTRQTINVFSDLSKLVDGSCDLNCRVSSYKAVKKGVQVVFHMKVTDKDSILVWEGKCYLLSRNTQKMSPTKPLKKLTASHGCSDLLSVDAGCGVRYAKVSGDWNPHHLWPMTSWLLGYRRPIAHGMWTLATTLATLQKKGHFDFQPPYCVDAEFKRPLFMPGSSNIISRKQDTFCKFEVSSATSEEIQLIGSVTSNKSIVNDD